MPGRHVTDQQAKLFMTFRHSHTFPVAAAKAGMSKASVLRLRLTHYALLRRERHAVGGGPIRLKVFPTWKSFRC